MGDDLLKKLESKNALAQIEAMRELEKLGTEAFFAVSRLAQALREEGYAHEPGTSDYTSVCETAAYALERIGPAATRVLLDGLSDDTEFDYPEMCYDQGAYIGDYASRTVRVCEIARDALRRMIHANPRMIDLIAELGKTASDEEVSHWVKMLT